MSARKFSELKTSFRVFRESTLGRMIALLIADPHSISAILYSSVSTTRGVCRPKKNP